MPSGVVQSSDDRGFSRSSLAASFSHSARVFFGKSAIADNVIRRRAENSPLFVGRYGVSHQGWVRREARGLAYRLTPNRVLDMSRVAAKLDLEMKDSETSAAPGIIDLFRGFLILGLTGFGGVLPLARHMVVDQRRWMTGAEFTELLSLCQFLPGGNIINLSVAIGLRFRGIRGAIAALVGLIAAPIVVVLVLGVIYARYSG